MNLVRKGRWPKVVAFLLMFAMVFTMSGVLPAWAADDTQNTAAEEISGIGNEEDSLKTITGTATISEGGVYTVQPGATGVITVTTTEKVTLQSGFSADEVKAGTDIFENLSIDCSGVTGGANLELRDMKISNKAQQHIVNFSGTNNVLTVSGTNLMDHMPSGYGGQSAVHVGKDASLLLNGDGTLYLYKSAGGAGIGGDSGEMNGDITFGDENSAALRIFAKGTKQSALIGAGSSASSGTEAPGKIVFDYGTYNLLSVSRGAAIGGSAGATGGSAGTSVYLNHASVNVNVDYTGSAVGGGGYAVGNDASGGNIYISGGSLRIFVDKNAADETKTSGYQSAPYTYGVNDAAMTAARWNTDGEGKTAVYKCIVDTKGLEGDTFTVSVDGEPFYTGGLHTYHYVNEALSKEEQTTPATTMDNWAANDDTNLYLYLTGEDHEITVNGVTYEAVFDGSKAAEPATMTTSGPFTVAKQKAPADTAWYDAEKDTFTLSTPAELAGLAAIVNGTAAEIEQDTFAGKTIRLGADLDLSAYEWVPIGGAAEKVSLTVSSQEDLDAAITEHKLVYDDKGNSYTVGAAKNPSYAEGMTYYYLNGAYFAGVFDGNGHTITNLKAETDAGYAGLFGNVSGTVENFAVSGSVTVNGGGDYAGGVVGMLSEGGRIADVTADVTVRADVLYNVGGIVGFVGTPLSDSSKANTIVERCVHSGAVLGYQKVGGVAGENAGVIRQCVNIGDVDAANTGSKNGVGGIVGRNGNNNTASETGTVEDCYNTGRIGNDQLKWVGGIVGFQNALSSVKNCYNLGQVSGIGQTNGLVGINEGTVSNSYFLNTVYSIDANGVYGGTVDEITGAKTEAELKAAAMVETLGANWAADSDVKPINGGYPLLQWQSARNTVSVTFQLEPSTAVVSVTDSQGMPVTAGEDGAYLLAVGETYSYQVTAEGYTTQKDTFTATENKTIAVSLKAQGGQEPTIPEMDLKSADWDGKTIDVSWYFSNPDAKRYYIGTAAEFAGVAALVNGLVNESKTWVYVGPNDEGYQEYYSGKDWNSNKEFVKTSSGESGGNNQSTDDYSYGIEDFRNVTITLMDDLDMSDGNYMPIGGQYLMEKNDSSTKIGSSFCGFLDGDGCTVKIKCDRYSSGNYGDGQAVGLIGRLGVHDDEKDNAPSDVGVADLVVKGSVKGNRSVGGVVGKIGKTKDGATIECCANFASVTGTDAKGTGGIVGAAWNGGTVENCYNAGHVTNSHNTYGGIAGSNEIQLINCYNSGTVDGAGTSAAIATAAGGTYKNCYWLTGSADMGVYNVADQSGVTEKTSEEMKTADFVNDLNDGGDVFVMDTTGRVNKGYPIFFWQSSGTPTNPGGNPGSGEEEDQTVNLTPKVTAKDGTAAVTVSASDLNNAITSAANTDAAAITITPQVRGDADTITITVPKARIADMAKKTTADLRLCTDLANLTVEHDDLAALGDLAGTNVVFTFEQTADNAVMFDVQVDTGSATALADRCKVQLPAADGGQTVVALQEDGSQQLVLKSIVEDGKAYAILPTLPATLAVIDNAREFADLKADAWYEEAIDFASGRELVNGIGNNLFAPNDNMTRGMLVTVLYRLEGEPEITADHSFTDVKKGAWYEKAVAWANAAGIVQGVGDNRFAPDDNITREEMAVIFQRYAKTIAMDSAADGSLDAYTDAAQISDWATDGMRWAVGQQIITGDTATTLNPGGSATRAEVVTMLQRLVENIVK